MIVKLCRGPANGGSARGAIGYILGYELGGKGAQQREAFHTLMVEAMNRRDLGTGIPWSPIAGAQKRPSSVYANGVIGLATADLEMEGIARGNRRVKSAVHHFVFSAGDCESQSITDAQLISFARSVIGKIGGNNHQYILSVHRDTDNPHVHVALGSVNPLTLKAFDLHGLHKRLHWAAREAEIELGLVHDRGLAVVREFEGSKRVEWATHTERNLWKAGARAERIKQHIVAVLDGQETPAKWADTVVAVRIQAVLDQAQESSEKSMWIDIHLAALAVGARCISQTNKSLHFNLLDRDGNETGETFEVAADRLQGLPDEFLNLDESETEFAAAVFFDQSVVSRRIIATGNAAFSIEHIEAYLARRLSDPEEIANLSELIQQNDRTLVVVSPDAERPLFSTKQQLFVENTVRKSAWKLAQNASGNIVVNPVDSISVRAFTVIQGESGSGKTTLMREVFNVAKATTRPIIGLTTSQAAARVLTNETGIQSCNFAAMIARESHGEKIIPRDAIIVLDEVSMASYSALDTTLRLAIERQCHVVAIGDEAQLSSIEAGTPLAMLADVARTNGTYFERGEVFRQRNAWHRDFVRSMGVAIRGNNADGIAYGISVLDAHGGVVLSESAMADAAAWYVAQYRLHGPENVSLTSDEKSIVIRRLNEQIRSELGITGGKHLKTVGGLRQLTTGDRIVFLKNDHHLGLVNGDYCTVAGVAVSPQGILVMVDLDASRRLTFDAQSYRDWDYGYATTIHKSQGRTVEASAHLVTARSTAEATHVALSRPRGEARLFVDASLVDSVRDLGVRLAEKAAGKTDALFFENIIQETGGPETPWAIRCRRALADEADPLRQEYAAEIRILHDEQSSLIQSAQTKYSSDIKALRSAVKEIVATPPPFSTWLVQRRQHIENDIATSERVAAARYARLSRENVRPKTNKINPVPLGYTTIEGDVAMAPPIFEGMPNGTENMKNITPQAVILDSPLREKEYAEARDKNDWRRVDAASEIASEDKITNTANTYDLEIEDLKPTQLGRQNPIIETFKIDTCGKDVPAGWNVEAPQSIPGPYISMVASPSDEPVIDQHEDMDRWIEEIGEYVQTKEAKNNVETRQAERSKPDAHITRDTEDTRETR